MSLLLRSILHPYMAPAGDADGGGGAVDRGDDFTPTDDDAAADTTQGAAGDDTVEGAGGEDTTQGAAGEDTTEGAGGEDTTEGADRDDKKPRRDERIPLKRHKEILAAERGKREQLEAQLKQFQGGQKVAQTNEQIAENETKLVKAEEDYNKAIIEGNTTEANRLMREIRALDRSIADARLLMSTQAAEARAIEQVRYDTTVERLEAAYPVLNPEHDDYDEATVAKVLRMQRSYQRDDGLPPAKALQAAVKDILGQATTKQEEATERTARVDPAEVEAKRKADAVKKATSTKQPPSTNKVGLDSDKLGGGINAKSIADMKYEDFIQLDEETLSRMRGDALA